MTDSPKTRNTYPVFLRSKVTSSNLVSSPPFYQSFSIDQERVARERSPFFVSGTAFDGKRFGFGWAGACLERIARYLACSDKHSDTLRGGFSQRRAPVGHSEKEADRSLSSISGIINTEAGAYSCFRGFSSDGRPFNGHPRWVYIFQSLTSQNGGSFCNR